MTTQYVYAKYNSDTGIGKAISGDDVYDPVDYDLDLVSLTT